MRVALSPPEVNEPSLQLLQDVAPLPLYFLSLLHLLHEDLPLPENLPAPHIGCAELPSQRRPAGQILQAERVVIPSPDVNEPGLQVLHMAAPLALYFLSAPHTALIEFVQ